METETDVRYWVLSEIETSPSESQKYLSESRKLKDILGAENWRDFIEEGYRVKGDDREVVLVKVMTPRMIREDIDKNRPV